MVKCNLCGRSIVPIKKKISGGWLATNIIMTCLTGFWIIFLIIQLLLYFTSSQIACPCCGNENVYGMPKIIEDNLK